MAKKLINIKDVVNEAVPPFVEGFLSNHIDDIKSTVPGPKGDKGTDGLSVHHIKPTNTTHMLGDFGVFGELDTYTIYGDADERINLGSFVVRNGIGPDQAEHFGFMTANIYDVNNNGIVDNAEALGGKSLAQIEAERAAEIRQAALDLGTIYSVADENEKNALTDLTVGDKVFVKDNGTGEWVQYIVTDTVDGTAPTTTFEVVMDQKTYLNAHSASSIKQAYESNLDTNAYTDNDKQKVNYLTVTYPTDLDQIRNDTNLNNIHRNSTGEDHSFIDQDVTTNASPTFVAITLTSNKINGRDLAADWNKLDTIEPNAKDDQVAAEVPYDNASSNLTSNNVQSAVDELDHRVYQSEGKLATIEPNAKDDQLASEVPYDNTTSEIPATDVQAAIDELDRVLDTAVTKLNGIEDNAKDDQLATEVPYDNTVSGLLATNVQGAIDEIDNRLDPVEIKLGTIEENAKDDQVASEVPYDASTSGMVASNVQSAIDEIDSRLDPVEAKLTTVEYNAKDDQVALEVPYNNSASGISATDVQSAIDEIDSRLDPVEGKLSTIEYNAKDDQIALEVPYDNSYSAIAATDVQAAIDEVDGRLVTVENELAVTSAKTASVVLVNSIPGIAGTDVQAVLEELNSNLVSFETQVNTVVEW